MQLHDNCDSCGKDYDFARERDIACLCLTNSRANHVIAKCPHCGNVVSIFTEPAMFLAIMSELKLTLQITTTPSADILEMMRKLGAADEGDMPEPARDVLTELHNWMRHFGGQCGTRCLFPECKEF